MPLLAAALALAFAQPPAWIQRAGVPGPIVTWRAADVLGSRAVEGIVVARDPTSHTVTVNVVDSRFDPPRIVKLRELSGSRVRWLRAGTRDGSVEARDRGRRGPAEGETAYLLRVRRGLRLEVVRKVRGRDLRPRTFSR